MGDSNTAYQFQHRFEGNIWSTILSKDGRSLILDVRDQEKQQITYWQLSMESLELERLHVSNISWWTSVLAFDGVLYLVEYQDQSDPTNKQYFACNPEKTPVAEGDLPSYSPPSKQPFLYEMGTEFHQTVSDFLGLTLPLACEYLEIGEKIILSYYLRSQNFFDRHLLIIDDGEKELKELQDQDIRGFAAGAFFVLEKYLCYVKNRNEICIYSL